MPKAPQMDPEAIRENIDALSRDPFREQLATWLQAAPQGDSIEEWANRHPDRWAQGLAIVGRLAGFSDKLEVEGTIQHVHELSDAEIIQRVQQLRAQAIDGECSEPAALEHGQEYGNDGQ